MRHFAESMDNGLFSITVTETYSTQYSVAKRVTAAGLSIPNYIEGSESLS